MWSLAKKRLADWGVYVTLGGGCMRAANLHGHYASTPCWGAAPQKNTPVVMGKRAMHALLQRGSMYDLLPMQGSLQGDSTQQAIVRVALRESVGDVRHQRLPPRGWSVVYALRYEEEKESTKIHAAHQALLNSLGFGSLRWLDAGQAIYHALGKSTAAAACHVCLDLGATTTRIFAYVLGELALWHKLDWGAALLDQALVRELEEARQIRISAIEAERIKWQIGSVHPLKQPHSLDVQGAAVRDGYEKTVRLEDSDVRDVLMDTCEALWLGVRTALEDLPVALLNDVVEYGMCLVGGGAKLMGLAPFLQERLQVPVWVASQPEWLMLQGGVGLQQRISIPSNPVRVHEVHEVDLGQT